MQMLQLMQVVVLEALASCPTNRKGATISLSRLLFQLLHYNIVLVFLAMPMRASLASMAAKLRDDKYLRATTSLAIERRFWPDRMRAIIAINA